MPAARDIKESVVDAAGEHISEEFKEKCVELGIVHKLPSTRKQSCLLYTSDAADE